MTLSISSLFHFTRSAPGHSAPPQVNAASEDTGAAARPEAAPAARGDLPLYRHRAVPSFIERRRAAVTHRRREAVSTSTTQEIARLDSAINAARGPEGPALTAGTLLTVLGWNAFHAPTLRHDLQARFDELDNCAFDADATTMREAARRYRGGCAELLPPVTDKGSHDEMLTRMESEAMSFLRSNRLGGLALRQTHYDLLGKPHDRARAAVRKMTLESVDAGLRVLSSAELRPVLERLIVALPDMDECRKRVVDMVAAEWKRLRGSDKAAVLASFLGRIPAYGLADPKAGNHALGKAQRMLLAMRGEWSSLGEDQRNHLVAAYNTFIGNIIVIADAMRPAVARFKRDSGVDPSRFGNERALPDRIRSGIVRHAPITAFSSFITEPAEAQRPTSEAERSLVVQVRSLLRDAQALRMPDQAWPAELMRVVRENADRLTRLNVVLEAALAAPEYAHPVGRDLVVQRALDMVRLVERNEEGGWITDSATFTRLMKSNVSSGDKLAAVWRDLMRKTLKAGAMDAREAAVHAWRDAWLIEIIDSVATNYVRRSGHRSRISPQQAKLEVHAVLGRRLRIESRRETVDWAQSPLKRTDLVVIGRAVDKARRDLKPLFLHAERDELPELDQALGQLLQEKRKEWQVEAEKHEVALAAGEDLPEGKYVKTGGEYTQAKLIAGVQLIREWLAEFGFPEAYFDPLPEPNDPPESSTSAART